ncbi:hypothetical protein Dimus_028911, partial [Dionaea muscipula]
GTTNVVPSILPCLLILWAQQRFFFLAKAAAEERDDWGQGSSDDATTTLRGFEFVVTGCTYGEKVRRGYMNAGFMTYAFYMQEGFCKRQCC